MKTYIVGGAVRDHLLGRPVEDRDWVVVGSTPQEMLSLGFTPVGDDFPVFLHPETKQEYALARTERKTAAGYHGFKFHAAADVTLEEDLARRDLTVNAMAMDDAGVITDPYGGRADLEAGVFRHVSDAFREDPVRILRVARFSARHPEATVAPETQALMREMVLAGEVDALVAERVWKEMSRALMEPRPSRFFEVLRACGALERLLPELDRLWGIPQVPTWHPEVDTGIHAMSVLDVAALQGAPLEVRFAALCHDFGKGTTPVEVLPHHYKHELRSADLLGPVCDRFRVPGLLRETALVVAREHGNIHGCMTLDAAGLVRLLERCDAVRRPERFADALWACECDARGRLGFENREYPQRQHLLRALEFARSVDTSVVAARAAAQGLAGPAVGVAIHAERVGAVHRGMGMSPGREWRTPTATRLYTSTRFLVMGLPGDDPGEAGFKAYKLVELAGRSSTRMHLVDQPAFVDSIHARLASLQAADAKKSDAFEAFLAEVVARLAEPETAKEAGPGQPGAGSGLQHVQRQR